MWKRLLFRLRLAWRVLRGDDLTLRLVAGVDDLWHSVEGEAARFAVQKVGLDTSLKAAHNEHLRREAVEWAGHWLKERGVVPNPWRVRAGIELAVGQLKEYL